MTISHSNDPIHCSRLATLNTLFDVIHTTNHHRPTFSTWQSIMRGTKDHSNQHGTP